MSESPPKNEPENHREGYLKYARTVLGIGSFVRQADRPIAENPPLAESRLGAEPSRPIRLFVLVPVPRGEFPLKAEVNDLLAKMIRAMKLEPSEVVTAEWVDDANAVVPEQINALLVRAAKESRPVILFGANSAGRLLGDAVSASVGGDWCQGLDGSRVLLTYSPFELLASPGKKSQTWTHLQALMKHLTV